MVFGGCTYLLACPPLPEGLLRPFLSVLFLWNSSLWAGRLLDITHQFPFTARACVHVSQSFCDHFRRYVLHKAVQIAKLKTEVVG